MDASVSFSTEIGVALAQRKHMLDECLRAIVQSTSPIIIGAMEFIEAFAEEYTKLRSGMESVVRHTRPAAIRNTGASSAQARHMTAALKAVWEVLDDKPKSAKEIAPLVDLLPKQAGTVRKRIQRLGDAGYLIHRHPGGGYSRDVTLV